MKRPSKLLSLVCAATIASLQPAKIELQEQMNQLKEHILLLDARAQHEVLRDVNGIKAEQFQRLLKGDSISDLPLKGWYEPKGRGCFLDKATYMSVPRLTSFEDFIEDHQHCRIPTSLFGRSDKILDHEPPLKKGDIPPIYVGEFRYIDSEDGRSTVLNPKAAHEPFPGFSDSILDKNASITDLFKAYQSLVLSVMSEDSTVTFDSTDLMRHYRFMQYLAESKDTTFHLPLDKGIVFGGGTVIDQGITHTLFNQTWEGVPLYKLERKRTLDLSVFCHEVSENFWPPVQFPYSCAEKIEKDYCDSMIDFSKTSPKCNLKIAKEKSVSPYCEEYHLCVDVAEEYVALIENYTNQLTGKTHEGIEHKRVVEKIAAIKGKSNMPYPEKEKLAHTNDFLEGLIEVAQDHYEKILRRPVDREQVKFIVYSNWDLQQIQQHLQEKFGINAHFGAIPLVNATDASELYHRILAAIPTQGNSVPSQKERRESVYVRKEEESASLAILETLKNLGVPPEALAEFRRLWKREAGVNSTGVLSKNIVFKVNNYRTDMYKEGFDFSQEEDLAVKFPDRSHYIEPVFSNWYVKISSDRKKIDLECAIESLDLDYVPHSLFPLALVAGKNHFLMLNQEVPDGLTSLDEIVGELLPRYHTEILPLLDVLPQRSQLDVAHLVCDDELVKKYTCYLDGVEDRFGFVVDRDAFRVSLDALVQAKYTPLIHYDPKVDNVKNGVLIDNETARLASPAIDLAIVLMTKGVPEDRWNRYVEMYCSANKEIDVDRKKELYELLPHAKVFFGVREVNGAGARLLDSMQEISDEKREESIQDLYMIARYIGAAGERS